LQDSRKQRKKAEKAKFNEKQNKESRGESEG